MPVTKVGGLIVAQATAEDRCSVRTKDIGRCTESQVLARAVGARASSASTLKFPTSWLGSTVLSIIRVSPSTKMRQTSLHFSHTSLAPKSVPPAAQSDQFESNAASDDCMYTLVFYSC